MADSGNRSAAGRSRYADSYYVDGNAVRERIPAQNKAGAAVYGREKTARVRYEKREAVLGLRYTLFLSIAICITIASCFLYMKKNIQLSSVRSEVTALQEDLRGIQEKNDSLKENLNNTTTDLNELYQKATQDLGMVYPDKDQIIYYNSGGGDYVRQYGAIPEDK